MSFLISALGDGFGEKGASLLDILQCRDQINYAPFWMDIDEKRSVGREGSCIRLLSLGVDFRYRLGLAVGDLEGHSVIMRYRRIGKNSSLI